MADVMELRPMARKTGRPKGDRNDVSKIDRAIMAKVKAIATDRGMSAAGYDELLETPVDRAYAAMLRKLDAKDRASGGEARRTSRTTEGTYR